MSKIHIITDSASDISVESEQELNIRVLPFPVILGGDSYISRIDFDNQGFYELMDRYPDEIPKTSQITPYEFETIYQEEYDAGYTDIVLVLINSGGSATCNNAKMSIDSFFDEHPEYKDRFNIYVYDSANYSGAYGYPVMVAAQMAKEQRDISDITAYLDKEIPKRRIYFG
ncbi:MAG: DegV family EDD domain-containing protein, partial [Lachnospiraceae bacterium]|nr:DegV family EDD domain-containing protein [Lachnospiraceae bacterium]